ncbi:hypothetical protein DFR58_11192 [Anaerobacterium chartisolvens]|uniref:Uncharacterized protein n=1 Tax=Anaerobacterium chartisolvens TaxID=1297424 RepID=A0A369B740_9FIRM|nr:hypothetical protein [Anaerobacterium chartisolvens]RCX16347.1 hypothetical protein DFR58_11192 [Anaerobacterium chartisolvens]
MQRTFIVLIFLLFIIGGGICLQVFLSRKNNKWLGLMLPIISFCFSLVIVLGFIAYNGMTGHEVLQLIAFTLFISNIPTVILIVIYFACREKLKRKKELDKMNIQDLE